jgi:hypothetical protein
MILIELHKRFRKYFGFTAPINGLLTILKGSQNAIIDIIKLDTVLSHHDPDYDPDACTYRNEKDISMSDYIQLKYGKEALTFIKNNMES